MPRKKSKKKTVVQEKDAGERVIQISNCQTVQIGENNRIATIVDDKVQTRGIQNDTQSKQALTMTILRNLLKIREKPIPIDELKVCVEETLRQGDKTTFEELWGMPLKDFLLMHPDDFEIKSQKKFLFVGLSKSNRETDNDVVSAGASQSLGSGSMEKESSNSSEESNSSDNKIDEQQSGLWQQVQKKKKKSKTTIKNTITSLAREIVRQQDDDDYTTRKFRDLVSKPENRDLLFVAGHEFYADHPEQCMHDIVCMWNTPQRTKSYIIIGVEKESDRTKLIGTDKDFDTSFYDPDELFSKEIFTMRPVYQYCNVEYDSKIFGMIEIASSSGQGQPSIVKCAYKFCDLVLNVNELWFRNGTRNIVCPPTDLTIGSIYQWFLGAFQTSVLPKDIDIAQESKLNISDHKEAYSDSLSNSESEQSKTNIKAPETSSQFSMFWEFVCHFKKGNFVLISGDVSNQLKNLSYLSLIDWVAVYDFDVFSCKNGLFNAVQDSLESRRQLRIGSWKDDAPFLSEDGTYWCFLRGRREINASRTDSPDGLFETTQSWFTLAKSGISDNCKQLEVFSDNYSVFTVVILWPKHEELVSFIRKFLDKLYECMSHPPKIVICLERDPATDIGKTQLQTMQFDYSGSIHTCILDFSQLCLGIKSHVSVDECQVLKFELPTANDCLSPIINNKDVVWLKEDLEVLYMENPYRKTKTDEKALEDEMNKFFKGGTLHWFARYEMNSSCVDIERDVLKVVEGHIQKCIEDNYRAAVVTIFHAPGSGGTTLAQRSLWSFHQRIPSCQVKSGTLLKSKDFERKISFIYEKTQLPVLLLVDGEDDTKIKYLSSILKHAIILHVKRFPWSMHKLCRKNEKDKVYLSGCVSPNEAEKLAAKFGERCDQGKQKRLNAMKDEVKKKKAEHYMYEFGMTVYHHEFKGLVSYVEGYLQLEKNSKEDLLPWQRCLGYLSLIYYYGQTSVPCQLFATLFSKPSGYCMTLEDFPYPVTEFVVHDTQDRKKNTVRICHFEVAREVLEQILARNVKVKSRHRSHCLGEYAKRNLASFCKELIEYCSKKKTKDTSSLQTVKHILTKTFIYRDERGTVAKEEQEMRKKEQVSQLLLDIPSSKPLFTERLQILEKLSSAFPNDPNYHAHVGRFHAFCGPDNEQKAEKRFETAIKLCEERNKGKQEDEFDDSMKSTLMHIFHMWGILKKRRIGSFTGKTHNDAAKIISTDIAFNEKLKELVDIAQMASDFFTKSRDMTPDQCDVFTHAFTSEIEVRLQICDYVMRHFKPKSEPDKIFSEFLVSTADGDSKYFVEVSIQKIERLILECYMDVNLETEDQTTLRRLVKWYNALFKKQVLPTESQKSGDDLSKIRQEITSLKLQHGAQNLSIEGVHDEIAFNSIIELYEEEFREIQSKGHGELLGKKEIEYDYREWIFGIRQENCKKVYQIEDVLMHVQNWHHLVRSPMSTYYLFVLKSLLGIGTETTPGKTECLIDAQSLKSDLSKKHGLVIRPKYPREWLGASGPGIKVLQTANRRIGLNENREAGKGLIDLAVCKGTICHPNNTSFGGQIELDMKVGTVKVFYIPKRVKLEGPRYAGQRVEFNLAFSIEHGYEAFNVKLLKRHGCSSCSATIEFRSVDESLACLCGEMIHKDHLNEMLVEHKHPIEDVSESEVFE